VLRFLLYILYQEKVQAVKKFFFVDERKYKIFLCLLKAVEIVYFMEVGKKDTLLMPKSVIKYILIVKQ